MEKCFKFDHNAKQKIIVLSDSGVHRSSTSYAKRESNCVGKNEKKTDIKVINDTNEQTYKNLIKPYQNDFGSLDTLGERSQKYSNGNHCTQNDLRTPDCGICTEETNASKRWPIPKNKYNNIKLRAKVPFKKSGKSKMSIKSKKIIYSEDDLFAVSRNHLPQKWQTKRALPNNHQTDASDFSRFQQGSTQKVSALEENSNISIPIVKNFLNTSKESYKKPECCSYTRQLCERHITQLLSLPENGLDPKMLSNLLVQDNEGRTKIDYFLVGKLLRIQSKTSVNVEQNHKQNLNDICTSEYRESQSISRNQSYSSAIYPSEELQDMSIKSSISNASYSQDSLSVSWKDIYSQNSRESTNSEKELHIKHYSSRFSLPKTSTNMTGKSLKNSKLVSEFMVPNTFNYEYLGGLDTCKFQKTPEQQITEIIELLPPMHKSSSEEVFPKKYNDIKKLSVEAVQSGHRNRIVNQSRVLNFKARENDGSKPFSQKQAQNDRELSGWQKKQFKNNTDSEVDFSDKELHDIMEPSCTGTNNLLNPKEDIAFRSDKRNLKRETSSDYFNINVPVIFYDPQKTTCDISKSQICCPLPCAIKINKTEPKGIPNLAQMSMQGDEAQHDGRDFNKIQNEKSIYYKRSQRCCSGQDRCGCCEQEAKNFCSVIEGYCQKKCYPYENNCTLSETDDQSNSVENFTNTSGNRLKKTKLLKEVIVSNDFGCCAPTCVDKGIQVYCCEKERAPYIDNQESNHGPRASHDQYNSGRITPESNVNLKLNGMNRISQGSQSENICDEVLIKVTANSDKNVMCEDQQQQKTIRSPRVSFDQNDNACAQNEQYYDICDELRTDTTKNNSDEVSGQQIQQGSSSHDNTNRNQQTIQPIVIPIMCYIPLPSICRVCYPYHGTQSCCSDNVPSCNLQCCDSHPVINSLYPCQCCEPQLCYTHQMCSCEVQSCDLCTPTCFPYQCCDPPCSSMPQSQNCCPQSPFVCTTSHTRCDPQSRCYIPYCDPQVKCVTLQIDSSNQGEKSSHKSQ